MRISTKYLVIYIPSKELASLPLCASRDDRNELIVSTRERENSLDTVGTREIKFLGKTETSTTALQFRVGFERLKEENLDKNYLVLQVQGLA